MLAFILFVLNIVAAKPIYSDKNISQTLPPWFWDDDKNSNDNDIVLFVVLGVAALFIFGGICYGIWAPAIENNDRNNGCL